MLRLIRVDPARSQDGVYAFKSDHFNHRLMI